MPSVPLRGVISDLDGVIYRGNTLIPGVAATIALWQRQGLLTAFVTNNSRHGADAVADKLTRLGLAIDPSWVVTSMEALAACAAERHAGAEVLVIGTGRMKDELAAKGLEPVNRSDVPLVALGFKPDLSIADLTLAVNALRGGAQLIASNPDTISPIEAGFEPCVGSFVALLKAAAPQIDPVFVGKPSPLMIHTALERLGLAPEEAVMVGDQPMTDILAGQSAGLRSFLVCSGVWDGTVCEEVVPEGIVDTIADLPVFEDDAQSQ